MERRKQIVRRFTTLAMLTLAVTACFSGCGKSGPMTVSGTVTLNGNPVDMGTVEFMPADGKGEIAVGTIEAGKYTAEVVPGAKKVLIEAQKKLGERHYRPGDTSTPMIPITQSLGRKELPYEIKPGETTVDFQLP